MNKRIYSTHKHQAAINATVKVSASLEFVSKNARANQFVRMLEICLRNERMSSKTTPVFIYGVRIDGLATHRQLRILAASCLVLLWLVVMTGSWTAAIGLIVSAIYLVCWCRELRLAADLCAYRKYQSECVRADLAMRAGRGAIYRLAMGLQQPLELRR